MDGAKRLNMSDFAATQLMQKANAEAEFGYSSRAVEDLNAALALSRDPTFVSQVADSFATAGQDKQAQALIDEVAQSSAR